MNLFLTFVFLFYIGSSIGWILELFYRRYESKKWVNPGFLVGPYLPIYGIGLVLITTIYVNFSDYNFPSYLYILFMGITMTILELLVGLIFLKQKIRLWDYRKRWLNYKGVICPFFTLLWTVLAAVYYFFLANHVLNALLWFNDNISFSYVLGFFSGLICIDFVYSAKLSKKIKKFAKNNDIIVKYEKLKLDIKRNAKRCI